MIFFRHSHLKKIFKYPKTAFTPQFHFSESIFVQYWTFSLILDKNGQYWTKKTNIVPDSVIIETKNGTAMFCMFQNQTLNIIVFERFVYIQGWVQKQICLLMFSIFVNKWEKLETRNINISQIGPILAKITYIDQKVLYWKNLNCFMRKTIKKITVIEQTVTLTTGASSYDGMGDLQIFESSSLLDETAVCVWNYLSTF